MNERYWAVSNSTDVESVYRQLQDTSGVYADVSGIDIAYDGVPETASANDPSASTRHVDDFVGAVHTGKVWTRWQYWVSVVLGIILFTSPWYTAAWGDGINSWNAWIAGGAIVIVALAASSHPAASWVNVFLGLWVFISPWTLGFALLTGATWTVWIIGVLVFLLALSAVSHSRIDNGRRGAII